MLKHPWFGESTSNGQLQNVLKLYKPQFFFFIEMKLDNHETKLVRRRYGFMNGIEVGTDGSKGDLCLAWKKEVDITLRSFSRNFIDMMVKSKEMELEWRFTGFYGSQFANGKSDSWNELRRLKMTTDLLWLVCGDFNKILYDLRKMVDYQEKKKE